MPDLVVTVTGLDSIAQFGSILKKVPIAAARAVNRAASKARAESSRRLRQQVAFSARYLTGPEGKIDFKQASTSNLTAKLSASSNPRSLARFVSASSKRQGVRVVVAPGQTRRLPGAFLLGIGQNTLLAVRSPTAPRTSFKPRKLGKSLWSLYGPSVAQALIARDNQRGIWPSMEAEIAATLEAEFLRQIDIGVPNSEL